MIAMPDHQMASYVTPVSYTCKIIKIMSPHIPAQGEEQEGARGVGGGRPRSRDVAPAEDGRGQPAALLPQPAQHHSHLRVPHVVHRRHRTGTQVGARV